MAKPFASTTDLEDREEALHVLTNGVYALTTQGDPNVAAVEGEEFLVCFDARATPTLARRWLDQLREYTHKPVRYLVLSHYHAVRSLGAAGLAPQQIIAHRETYNLIAERGMEDWAVEFGRMPRLFTDPESISGLTWPTLTFSDHMSIPLGGDRGRLELTWHGRGHTSGDVVAWLPAQRILLTGDLVENQSAVYTGDGYHREWLETLHELSAYHADTMVCGRGPVARGRAEVVQAVDMTTNFLETLIDRVATVLRREGSLEEAYRKAHEALFPMYGSMAVFEHALVFDVQRAWDELRGEQPRTWTVQRDHIVWDRLQS